MKALNIFFIIFSISIFFVNAQDFKGGIIAGMNTSQIRGDAYLGFNKVGFIFGGFANIDLTKQLKVQYEIIYIGKGSKKPINPDKGQYDLRLIKLNYVEIPVVLTIRHKKPEKTIHKNITYEAGLSYGVLISSKEMDESGETTIIGPFHKSEFAFQLGLNYALTEKTFINFRYSRSILPITGNAVVTRRGIYGGAFNNIICLSLRYQFLK
ncbi:MAG: PorT family protein [Bacteroidetes bacterium]|nr:PorT family protein [Bacteroidota bacterium]